MITRPISRPVASPIARAVNAQFGALSFNAIVQALFRNGEQGLACDQVDFAALFQESSGTTPITASGQPVGLQLDKSHGVVRSSEVVGDGSFDLGFAGTGGSPAPGRWYQNTASPTFTISGGVLSFNNTTSTQGAAQQALTVGKWYEVAVYVDSVSLGGVRVIDPAGTIASTTSAGVIRCIYRASSTAFTIAALGTTTAVVSSVSVREISGNHRYQATPAQRPMLRQNATTGKYWIDYDTVDDKLTASFPSTLGSNCTIARSIPGVGAQILTGQTVGTTFDDAVDSYGIILINRALTPAETANVTRALNRMAGV